MRLRRRRWDVLAPLWPEFAQLARDDPQISNYYPVLIDEIVERLQLPSKRRVNLQAPRLQVTTGRTFSQAAQFIAVRKNYNIIVFDIGLHVFINRYVRAASTYFLPQRPRRASTDRSRARPSKLWPPARDALAIILDWTASRAGVPIGPPFVISPYQAQQSWSLVRMAEIFGLCHELAHVIAGDMDSKPKHVVNVDEQPYEVCSISEEDELEADGMGMAMMLRTLPPTDVVLGLAGSVYLLHALGLLEMFFLNIEAISEIVNDHPSVGVRFEVIREVVRSLLGDETADGLQNLNEQLMKMDVEVMGKVVEKWQRAKADLNAAFDYASMDIEHEMSFMKTAKECLKLSPTAVTEKLYYELDTVKQGSSNRTFRRIQSGVLNSIRFLDSLRPELQRLLMPPELLGIQYEQLGPAFFGENGPAAQP
jgi:hypothetical protein